MKKIALFIVLLSLVITNSMRAQIQPPRDVPTFSQGISIADIFFKYRRGYFSQMWIRDTTGTASLGTAYVWGKRTADLSHSVFNLTGYGAGIGGVYPLASFISPAMTSGNFSYLTLGKATNTGNSNEAFYAYRYINSNSDSNALFLAFANNNRPLVVQSNLRVGVNTPYPSETLEVTGNAKISGVSSVIKAPDGASNLPSYTFTSSPGNGMFLLSSNVLSFSSNGTEAARITGNDWWIKRATLTLNAGNQVLTANATGLGLNVTPLAGFHTIGTVRHTGLGNVPTDSTTYKPVVIDASGNFKKSEGWPVGAGGASGTTSPTATDLFNTDGVDELKLFYSRSGNIVTGNGYAFTRATGAGTATFQIPLPIASDFTAVTDAAGPGSCGQPVVGSAYTNINVTANIANNKLLISMTSPGSPESYIYFSFSYEVK